MIDAWACAKVGIRTPVRNPFSPHPAEQVLSPSVALGTTLDTAFVSLIAHEIRSPLSAIRGAVALLGDHHERLSPERRGELLTVVDDSTLQIDRVVQDLMVLSRLNDGALAIEPVDVDIAKIVRDVARALNSRFPERAVMIALEDDVPAVYADAIRVRQIVTNLVANAISYSREKTTVIVSIVRDGDRVRTSVFNEGLGIPPNEQAKLFTPFAILSERTAESTGLGLFIAKGLVEAMHGAIGFSTHPGEHVLFWFTLPFGLGARAAPPVGEPLADALR